MSDTEFIVIIRPNFKKFCKDACRAAALNHLLFRIAYKCKDQAKEKVQNGGVLWYATNEQITQEMSHAWGTCKVGKEINALTEMGLIGRTSDPTWGVNRTKHFFFGKEQCSKFIQICEEHTICLVHLDLPPEVKHLLYTTLAIDKSIKCSCKEGEGNLSNHQMQFINSSDAFDKSIEAITKKDYKDTNKEDTYDADASLPHVFSDDELLALLRERGYSVTNQPELSTPTEQNVDNSPEPLATCNPIATDTPQPTQNENGSQSELIARPEKPDMPPTSMKLSAEKIVQITEALIGKYYNAKQRPKQIIAAKKILAEGVTEEQYIAAYSDMRPWWNENQGVFHVVDLAAQTQRKQMRVLELIEKIETRGHLKLVKPAPQVDSSNEGHKTAQELFEEKNRMLSERFMKKRTS
jgi:hypothetical protein